MNRINEDVKDYYGKTLSKSEDLKTNACCTLDAPPTHIQNALSNVHDEVQAKYYGCGLTIPENLHGLKILDLGSGSGRDCYIAAQLVGETGQVVGVDMTKEQLAVANEYIGYHKERFGYKESNVTFLEGNIEKLDELNLEENSFDLIISNCVINLASDKQKVLNDAYKLLKDGGEMYFSDVYSDRRISKELQEDQVLWGECLSGALYWNDFHRYAKTAGFVDPRAVENKEITINNKELEKKVGKIKFYSITYRLFKVSGLEDAKEDYGQAVRYKGNLSETPEAFLFDESLKLNADEITAVDGNTFTILKNSRFENNFDFFAENTEHRGIFKSDSSMPKFECAPKKTSCC